MRQLFSCSSLVSGACSKSLRWPFLSHLGISGLLVVCIQGWGCSTPESAQNQPTDFTSLDSAETDSASAPGADGAAAGTGVDADVTTSEVAEPGDAWGIGDGAGPNAHDADGSGQTDDSANSDAGIGCQGEVKAGRKGIHRLNRAEYDNVIRDLVGLELGLALDFPADDHAHGFDNIADALATSPNLVEKLSVAADRVVEEALWIEDVQTLMVKNEAEFLADGCGTTGDYVNLCTNSAVLMDVEIKFPGEYVISSRVAGQQAGPELVKVAFVVNGSHVKSLLTASIAANPEIISTKVELGPGAQTVGVEFVNDYWNPSSPDPNDVDRNLLVDWVQLEGPDVLPPPSKSIARDAILVCQPQSDATQHVATCAEEILLPFAQRAWRRPLADGELLRLVALVQIALEEGDTFEAGVRLALSAVLLSPNFLYRSEKQPEFGQKLRPLDDFELASRLSFFLWSSIPDEALWARALAGQLQTDVALEEEVVRMLAHPKAAALTENFAGQWLHTRDVVDIFKDSATYPIFDPVLAQSMRTETDLVFEEAALGSGNMLDLVHSDYSWIDERLAALYGFVPVPGDGFYRVSLPPGVRGGVLGQASWLATTSHPGRTSPVRRGKWILGQLLCSEPEPPPNDIPPLPEGAAVTGNIKEIMALHAADPKCATCHLAMDPLGLVFENYDGIGAWRTHYNNGDEVDPVATLLTGEVVPSAAEMQALLRDSEQVALCIVQKVATYALGRGLGMVEDACLLNTLTSEFAASGHRFPALVRALVLSPAFRMIEAEVVP